MAIRNLPYRLSWIVFGILSVALLGGVAAPLAKEGASASGNGEIDAPVTLRMTVPTKIMVQGFLADSAGTVIDNEDPGVDFEVRIWDAETNGNELYLEAHAGVPVSKGAFALKLGEFTPLDPSIFDGTLYFGVSVAGESELPRTEIVSAPFSIRSQNADLADGVAPGVAATSLNGLTDDVLLLGGSNVTIDEAGNTITIHATGSGGADSDWTVSGADLYAIPPGNVGLGTSSPTSKLHLRDTGSLELRIEADTDNSGETDHPSIFMTQDGGAVRSWIGYFGDGTVENDFVLRHSVNSDSAQIAIRQNTDIVLTTDGNVYASGDIIIGGSDTKYDSHSEVVQINSRSETWLVGVQNEAVDTDSDFFIGRSSLEDGIFHIEHGGNVGIGTNTPQSKLHVGGDIRTDAAIIAAESISTGLDLTVDRNAYIDGSLNVELAINATDVNLVNENDLAVIDIDPTEGDGPVIFLKDDNGNKTIEIDGFENNGGGEIKLFDGTPTAAVTVELDGNTGRVITKVLEITGGSDLSEKFSVDGQGVEPGAVVCIDPLAPGSLQPSAEAYDRRVAGVVSGAGGVGTGLLMGHDGTVADGEHPVALTGRVFCKVDASYGAIEPGDLLTTSPTAGHAMRVSDQTRAQGAILGKAMGGLSQGRGEVLILVTLQ